MATQKFTKGLKLIFSSHMLLMLIISIFFTAFAFISVTKHERFQTYAWDLSFFDELIWKASAGIEPRSSLVPLHLLGDHFQPILYLLVPLYFLRADVNLLLIAHAAVAVLGVIPIYLLAEKLVKNKFFSLALSIAYLLSVPFQFSVLDGFHQTMFAPLCIGFLYYFLETKNFKGYWLSLLGLLSIKEEYALLAFAIGLVVWFKFAYKKIAIITMFLSILWFFASIYIFIPFFQGGRYTHFGYGAVGQTPGDVALTAVRNPLLIIKLLVTPTVKIKTVITTFFSFGFLPLGAPALLIPLAQQFFVRFIDTVTVHRWLNYNHYSFPLAPLLSVGVVYTVTKYSWLKKRIVWVSVYIIFFALLQEFVLHGPLNTLLKPSFYVHEAWESDAHALIKQVPKTAVIASQNSLLPHLSQRQKYLLLPDIGDAQYIAVDLHDGPNKYSPATHEDIAALVAGLVENKQYTIVWQSGESMLLQKNN